jgi:hypothetical protein
MSATRVPGLPAGVGRCQETTTSRIGLSAGIEGNAAMRRMGEAFIGHRAKWLVLALWLGLAALVPVAWKLQSIGNDDIANYLPESAQSTRVAQVDRDAASAQIGKTGDAGVRAGKNPYGLVIEAGKGPEVRRVGGRARAALHEGHVGLSCLEKADVLDRADSLAYGRGDALAGQQGSILLAVVEVRAGLGPGRNDDMAGRRGLDEMVGDRQDGERDQDRRRKDPRPLPPRAPGAPFRLPLVRHAP